MAKCIHIVVVITLYACAVVPKSYGFDEMVKQSDLIVLGTATAFGEKEPPDYPQLYSRNLHIEIKEVLWPPSPKTESPIVLRYFISENWPASQWNFSNSQGVFFFIRNPVSGEYTMLGNFQRSGNDKWITPATNTLPILISVEKIKGPPKLKMLPWPLFRYPRDTRYDAVPKLRMAYLTALREGFYNALNGKHGLFMYGPNTDEEKAKVLGYADGQLAGSIARQEWTRKFDALMK